jgi:hypothetical protein
LSPAGGLLLLVLLVHGRSTTLPGGVGLAVMAAATEQGRTGQEQGNNSAGTVGPAVMRL